MSNNKLQRLADMCKASVTVNINQHRDFYCSVEDDLRDSTGSDFDGRIATLEQLCRYHEISENVITEMIARDALVSVQFYQNTANGFNIVFHYDVDAAIDECLLMFSDNIGDEQ